MMNQHKKSVNLVLSIIVTVCFFFASTTVQSFVISSPQPTQPSLSPSLSQLGLFRSKQQSAAGIQEIESHADWLELLHDSEEEEDDDEETPTITAVTFHASWCKFCQKFKMKWYRKLVRPLVSTTTTTR